MYLCWFDDDSKRSVAQKIANGIARYQERFKCAPTVVLVNEVDMAVVPNIRVEPRAHIYRNNFWIGQIVEEGRG